MESVAIIVNYNDWALTKYTAIEHVHNKVFNKIIIVDNCSSDESYGKLLQLSSEKIHILKADKNGGYGYGNNLGAKYAIQQFNPKYIIIMNPDVVVQKESIESCIAILEQHQTIGSISPIMKNPDGQTSKNFAWKQLSFFQECIGISVALKTVFKNSFSKIYYHQSNDSQNYKIVEVIPGSLVVFRAQAFIEAGMYDENIFLFTEERAIAKRLIMAGYATAICNGTDFVHYHSKTINKVITGYRKHIISLESKVYFLKTYNNINQLKILIFKVLCIFSIIEFILLIPLKIIYRKLFIRSD